MPVVKSREIHCRDDFPLLLNWRRLYEPAVEVGVDRGEYSMLFLSRWYGDTFYGVDDYQPYPGMAGTREPDVIVASTRYSHYPTRARLIRGKSSEVAPALYQCTSRRFDFVYIDANHEFEGVTQDINTWWPYLTSNGILAGHDYDDTHPGVMRAVSEFAEANGLTAYLTYERLPSWYIYRSGIPNAETTAMRLPADFKL